LRSTGLKQTARGVSCAAQLLSFDSGSGSEEKRRILPESIPLLRIRGHLWCRPRGMCSKLSARNCREPRGDVGSYIESSQITSHKLIPRLVLASTVS